VGRAHQQRPGPCQRLAVTVPPLDDTSLERIEELVDAAQWRTALGEALTRLSTALTRPATTPSGPPSAWPNGAAAASTSQVLDWWVGGTSPWAPGEVLISAVPERPDRAGLDPGYLRGMRWGC
jgi:hypothetical protein